MVKFFKPLIVIIVTILFFQSCIKDNFDFNKLTTNNVVWNPNLGIPVAFATLNLRDLLQDYDSTELFVEDGTGFLYIMYESKVVSVDAANLIFIPNQQYQETFTVPDLIAQAPGMGYYAKKDTIKNFGVSGDERIDSIRLKSCDLNVIITSSFLHTGTVKITFPSVRLSNQPLVITVPINTSDGAFLSNTIQDIGTYTIDLSNSGIDDNKLPVTIELFLDDSGNPINSGNQVTIDFNFTDIKFKAAFGYLGQKNINIALDSINLEMYTNALEGTAYFEDPKINAKITNSYGIPIRFKLDNLSAYSNVYNNLYSINLPPYYNPLIINAPTINQLGQSKITNINLNKTNCNIQEVISNLPKYIFYSVDAMTNPDPNVNDNFVLDVSKFDVDVEVELPLWGRAKYFVLQDTTKFNFSDFMEDIKIVDWALFRTNITNGFPVEVGIQIYFTDSLYNVVDSLFGQQTEVISSGIINSDGRVVQSTLRSTDMLFSRDRLRRMEPVKYALFRGYANTTNNAQELVKIYTDYDIDIQIGIQTQLTVKPNEY